MIPISSGDILSFPLPLPTVSFPLFLAITTFLQGREASCGKTAVNDMHPRPRIGARSVAWCDGDIFVGVLATRRRCRCRCRYRRRQRLVVVVFGVLSLLSASESCCCCCCWRISALSLLSLLTLDLTIWVFKLARVKNSAHRQKNRYNHFFQS